MPVETVLKETKVRHLALSPLVQVKQGAALGDVFRVMKEARAGYVLICDNERIAGIFTERDLLTKLTGSNVNLQSEIDAFMTPNPRTLDLDASVGDAVRLMFEGSYRDLPLIDEQGNVTGVVTVRDIIDFLAEHFPAEVLNLPPRVDQTMDAPEGA